MINKKTETASHEARRPGLLLLWSMPFMNAYFRNPSLKIFSRYSSVVGSL